MSFWTKLPITTRYSQLSALFYTFVSPQPLANAHWLMWNGSLAEQLGLPRDANNEPELLAALSGQSIPTYFSPLAMKYAGHQFGAYNPDLGDGRGLLLAELTDRCGTVWDLHIKGAGQTPYSRMGDGRAVLRSTIREYLCSEAMAGLGIPTTRALAMLGSDTIVEREQLEKAALLIRAAHSHIRFGHFEHLFYTNQLVAQKELADKVIEWHFPQCQLSDKPYSKMFQLIAIKTAEMIAYWQAYGFAHGVMNTDNMSILGQTFDYGPFGFLDDYDPSYICNHSDYQGRYSFERQPSIALWNLTALAHALSALIDKDDLERSLAQFETELASHFSRLMRQKLGLRNKHPQDSELFNAMFDVMIQTQVDYSRFFRELSCIDRHQGQGVMDLFVLPAQIKPWLARYRQRCELECNDQGEIITDTARCKQMRKVNPKFILRNYLAQQAIEKAELGDYSEVEVLTKLLATPFDEHEDLNHYANLPPNWGKKMIISCSS
ncbi:hypothetical protein BCU68_14900 [Vibrio sp. 10N.286.49.B3]|uniref:protein adenylyltransferase SelO n=1 Tax=Vibrio sp. 10N.286.49.B3 TaxID=1880855 RepID=UPI000C83FF7A|nr:YdiU family protein [Vibrio sp. 10N.286.49.B3]PMH41881.1 hypothetical protein BCU68_14900 [Vibrio sp. 10N.286.49.B3]